MHPGDIPQRPGSVPATPWQQYPSSVPAVSHQRSGSSVPAAPRQRPGSTPSTHTTSSCSAHTHTHTHSIVCRSVCATMEIQHHKQGLNVCKCHMSILCVFFDVVYALHAHSPDWLNHCHHIHFLFHCVVFQRCNF